MKLQIFLCYQNYAYFSIDDLNYLQKGGRIGKASAFLGTTLKIKPILSFEKENGEIYVPAKVRGSKKVKSKLIDLIESHLEENPHQNLHWLLQMLIIWKKEIFWKEC